MENFNLKKFLVENKLTTNSRMLSEAESYEQVKADLLAKAQSIANSPKMHKAVADFMEKITPEQRKKLLALANNPSAISENITKDDILSIANKALDAGIVGEEFKTTAHDNYKSENIAITTETLGQSIARSVGILTAGYVFLAPPLGLIYGMLLGGGPEALEVVGPHFVASLGIGAIVLIAKAISSRRRSSSNDTPSEPTTNNTGMNPKVLYSDEES